MRAYADTMEIDYREAERRLTIQFEMDMLEQKIAKDEAYFASWMQHKPDFGLVVSFTTADGDERIADYLDGVDWADLVKVKQSGITRDELTDMRHKVVTEAKKTGIPFGSGLNYQTGQVRLYTEQAEKLRSNLASNTRIAPIIDQIEFIEEARDKPADYGYPYLSGGQAICKI